MVRDAKPKDRDFKFGLMLRKTSNELLLASGQYALFHILMNLCQAGMGFFSNVGHVALLGFLFIQTVILVLFGDKPGIRFLGSLIPPVIGEFGVGIHFGHLVIGDIGSDERKNFTVIGDTVNITSRQ
jgi:hypothetical protein